MLPVGRRVWFPERAAPRERGQGPERSGGRRIQVLITGGAGFIGSHLAQRLVSLGHRVRVLDNFSTGRPENLAEVMGDVEVIEGDVRAEAAVRAAVRGCETILHQAALPNVQRSIEDPRPVNDVNVSGTLNVLLAARDAGTQRVMLASSSSVYGASPRLPQTEAMAPAPRSPYGAGKLAAEAYCRSFNEAYGLETVALRYFNVFGPRQSGLSSYATVVPRFIDAMRGDAHPTIFGDGEQSRDFTYIDNVIEANMLVLLAQPLPEIIFNIGCGERTTLNSLLAEIGELFDRTPDPHYAEPLPGEARHTMADISRARALLGFDPHIGLSQGLRMTIEHALEAASAH